MNVGLIFLAVTVVIIAVWLLVGWFAVAHLNWQQRKR